MEKNWPKIILEKCDFRMIVVHDESMSRFTNRLLNQKFKLLNETNHHVNPLNRIVSI